MAVHSKDLECFDVLPAFISNHYKKLAAWQGVPTFAAVLADLSLLAMVGGRSGVQLIDPKALGVLHPSSSINLNGGRGIGKSRTIAARAQTPPPVARGSRTARPAVLGNQPAIRRSIRVVV